MQRKTETIYNAILAAFSATYFNILILAAHILGEHVEPTPPTHKKHSHPRCAHTRYRQLHMKSMARRPYHAEVGVHIRIAFPSHRMCIDWEWGTISCSNMLELYRIDCDRFANHPLNASTLTYFRQERVLERNKCVCLGFSGSVWCYELLRLLFRFRQRDWTRPSTAYDERCTLSAHSFAWAGISLLEAMENVRYTIRSFKWMIHAYHLALRLIKKREYNSSGSNGSSAEAANPHQ